MDTQLISDAIEKANCALNMARKIIGVKFLYNDEEFQKTDARPLAVKMPYCVMVKSAMSGKSIKATTENSGCPGATRALGFAPVDDLYLSGRHYEKLGLYQDLITSKSIRKNMSVCQHKVYGLVLKPLEEFTKEPDVVLIVSNTYNAMRLLQGYTNQFGYHTTFQMSGNQAICSECTAYPFENNSINVSLLCSGTRYKGGWGDDEVGIGFPFNRFLSIVKGLYATINPTEPNNKKKEIEARLVEKGRHDLEIIYNQNYYTGLYQDE